jgi:hypothetical protein
MGCHEEGDPAGHSSRPTASQFFLVSVISIKNLEYFPEIDIDRGLRQHARGILSGSKYSTECHRDKAAQSFRFRAASSEA